MEPSVFEFYDKKKKVSGSTTTQSYYKNRESGLSGRSVINNLVMSEKDLFGDKSLNPSVTDSVT